ncbi:MAG: type II secretion protein F [Actinomycetia bacterium]|nr:type II secretion protein F [Actinomycetes bacterium]MCP5033244.1 type II secretion protein F [Actinomycetes bacterium]
MSQILVVMLAGTGFGLGLLLIILGLRGIEVPDATPRHGERFGLDRLRLRLTLAAFGAVILWALSGWPVGALLAASGGFIAPTLVGAKARRQASIAKIEAIAGWAEQLRDTIGASAGLQEAIVVTARVAPPEIRPAVQDLAAGLRRNNLSTELRDFAEKIDDPSADQIVVALILASERRGQNLTQLLSEVAASSRDDASMRIRTETSRAQTYSDAKVVSGIVVGMFLFMLLFNRAYLAPFDRVTGQLVLAVVGTLWAFALYGIAQLSVVRRPPRLLAAGLEGATATPGPVGEVS